MPKWGLKRVGGYDPDVRPDAGAEDPPAPAGDSVLALARAVAEAPGL